MSTSGVVSLFHPLPEVGNRATPLSGSTDVYDFDDAGHAVELPFDFAVAKRTIRDDCHRRCGDRHPKMGRRIPQTVKKRALPE